MLLCFKEIAVKNTSKTLILYFLALGSLALTSLLNSVRLDGGVGGRPVSLAYDGDTLVAVHGQAHLLREDDQGDLPEVVKPMFFHPFSINKAGPELLATVPGIGPVLAGRITNHRRRNGVIATAEDLRKVKGIGKKKAELIMEYTTFDL